jgi:hypothetical protein
LFSKLPFKFAYSVEDEEGVAAAAAADDDININNNSLLLLHFGTTLLSVGISSLPPLHTEDKKQLCVNTQMPTDKSYSYENLPGYVGRSNGKRSDISRTIAFRHLFLDEIWSDPRNVGSFHVLQSDAAGSHV